jgi:hypothetical protein
MTEALIILLNMRGGCTTVGDTVHTLFRVNGRRPRRSAATDEMPDNDKAERAEASGQVALAE